MRIFRRFGAALKDTVTASIEHGIPARGASLSFYVVFSLGPLLVLLVGALELVLGAERVRDDIVRSLDRSAGTRMADTVEMVLSRIEVPDLLSIHSLLSLLLLVIGSTAAFVNLRASLNAIWEIEPEIESPKDMALDVLKARVRGFIMVVVTGLILAVSFLVTSLLGAFGGVIESRWATGPVLVWGIDALLSILVTSLLFGAIYRTLPARRINWDTVWVGALATAVIFTVGKSLVAWLLGGLSWASYFGPAASFVAFLAWIYFSAQLLFAGAVFTQVWARRGDSSRLGRRYR